MFQLDRRQIIRSAAGGGRAGKSPGLTRSDHPAHPVCQDILPTCQKQLLGVVRSLHTACWMPEKETNTMVPRTTRLKFTRH